MSIEVTLFKKGLTTKISLGISHEVSSGLHHDLLIDSILSGWGEPLV